MSAERSMSSCVARDMATTRHHIYGELVAGRNVAALSVLRGQYLQASPPDNHRVDTETVYAVDMGHAVRARHLNELLCKSCLSSHVAVWP